METAQVLSGVTVGEERDRKGALMLEGRDLTSERLAKRRELLNRKILPLKDPIRATPRLEVSCLT